MPSVDADTAKPIAFTPITKDHIQNCSYDSWFPRHRSQCLKSRIIPLPPDVVAYLQEDGIVLADDEDNGLEAEDEEEWHSSGAANNAPRPTHPEDSSDDEDDENDGPNQTPPNKRFPETHNLIKEKIKELGGAVAPKLNWSSPQDAKWISPHQNTLKCTSPNDIYLLLKSSLFVSHDLTHAFDGCTSHPPSRPFTPILVLRPFFVPHAALEFRCFVKHRSLIGITQRDLNYYAFLAGLRPSLWKKISLFFKENLKLSFPDGCFVFDIYVPENSLAEDGLGRVRLIDINPWAPSTDSLLFSWQELLDWEVKKPLYGSVSENSTTDTDIGVEDDTGDDEEEDETDDDTLEYKADSSGGGAEFRLIERDDPAAYNFSSSQYSAHKLPKEVVDASMAGPGGLREFAQQWKEITEGRGDGIWENAAAQQNQ